MFSKTSFRFFLALLFSFFFNETFAQEEQQNTTERVISFHADIKIDSSGLMHVSEKIKVYAAGDAIKRGLVRSIPTVRKDIFGEKKKIDFKITSILKDGKKENFKTQNTGGSRTIYIGNENIIIPPGIYVYEINYQTKGHVGFFKDYDEIYWNVTGSEWDFQIEQASATIKVPGGALPIKTACYTGRPGSKAKNCNITTNPDHSVTFKTDGGLGRGEGFTVAEAFTRDIIQRPSALETFLKDYFKVAITFILLAILATYYYISWSRYGRDPKKDVVIPTFNIPNNWSPALLRYFYKKKIDEKSFALSIINMAVKKVIKITKAAGKKEDYALERSTELTSVLSKEENVIYTRWFNKKNRIYINKSNGSAINAAKNAHESALKPQLDLKEFFISYRKPLIRSILVTAVVLILFMVFIETGTPLMMLFFSPFITIGGYCFVGGIKTIRESFFVGLFLTIWGAGFGGVPLGMLIFNIGNIPTLSIIFVAVSTGLFILYINLIKAPTQAGAETIGKIEGFKMYLETAEQHRLNMLNPPELTPALFEKFLPYAIALDVENAWGAKFESILSEADYMPDWYDGDRFPYNRFSHGFIQPFNSAVSDSKPESSSSSSSGSSSWSSGSSSGSSGGGGGGGGGGGW